MPRIALLPVKNETRFAINKEIFLKEIRTALNEKAAGKILFLARDRMAELEKEREMKQSGQVTSNTDPNVNQFKGADYMLTGELTGLTTRRVPVGPHARCTLEHPAAAGTGRRPWRSHRLRSR